MPDPHDDVVRRFAEACRAGDVAALLDPEVVALCDGGGSGPMPGPVHGAGEVGRLCEVLLCGRPGADLTVESVNGRPGLALRRGGRVLAVVAVRVTETHVAALWIVVSPPKLARWHRG
jgi:RNA polymerase sigma-70 factor (ECF subfamily)